MCGPSGINGLVNCRWKWSGRRPQTANPRFVEVNNKCLGRSIHDHRWWSATTLRAQGVRSCQPDPPAPLQRPGTKRLHDPGQPQTKNYYRASAPFAKFPRTPLLPFFCEYFSMPPKFNQRTPFGIKSEPKAMPENTKNSKKNARGMRPIKVCQTCQQTEPSDPSNLWFYIRCATKFTVSTICQQPQQ